MRLIYKDRMKKLGLLSLVMSRLRGFLSASYCYLKDSLKR